ncbi:MAG: 1-acyl-sn-glycerol-3-phosphate acyltransferase, partial [Puniceicoccales bacterium]|nr:1-acyl-sn-glycerol-3-phosphate acyltransferase [Puniceicoccales bacterium]
MSAMPSPAYSLSVWFCRSVLREFFSLTVAGEEHVPAEGPCIIASNHASFLDPPAVGGRPGPARTTFAPPDHTRDKLS